MYNSNFIDLFSGCGGFSLGLLSAGWQGDFAIEKNKDAFNTYNHNLINEKNFNWPKWLEITNHDIENVMKHNTDRLSKLKIDLIVGGPPCQGFSTAGKRNANDPRNNLTNFYLQFIDIIKPNCIILENVKGITMNFDNSENTNYAKEIIKKLSINYDLFYQIINMSYFGIPQNRKRFILVGIKKKIQYKGNFFEEFFEWGAKSNHIIDAKSAISDFEIFKSGMVKCKENDNYFAIKYGEIQSEYQNIQRASAPSVPFDTRLANHKDLTIEKFKKIIDYCHENNFFNKSIPAEFKKSLKIQKQVVRVLNPNEPSPTITGAPEDLLHYSEPRVLTVRENARLQGFPDWYSFKGAYTTGGKRRQFEVPRYTQIANAVPPIFAEKLGRFLLEIL